MQGMSFVHHEAPPLRPGQVFVQVFNLRNLAIVYYLCLAVAASRMLGWLPHEPGWLDWVFVQVRFTRQTLITGVLLLLAVALVETALAAGWLPRRRATPWRVAAVVLAAAGGAWLRFQVASLGDPAAHLRGGWLLSTVLLWSLIGGTGYALLLAARAEQQTQAALEQAALQHSVLQAQQMQAQLSALNAQIEPHFLFNTLANVKRLYETAPERGREMMASLITYLRAALPSMRRSESTLAQELELVRSYLAILQMRMGPRLAFEIEAEPALLDAALPPMVLPTLVENAIKHGLAPLPEGGRILIRAQRQGDDLSLEVADDGRGFSGSGGSGVGLANTRARLAAMFGGRAGLELQAAEPRGVVARVRLPLSHLSNPAAVPAAVGA